MYGEKNYLVHKPELFEMTTLPVELGEVKLPGAEWNKIARMLEERDRLLKAKSVLVFQDYGLREVRCTYKTMSEDEHVQELARLSAEVEELKQGFSKKESELNEANQRFMQIRLSEERQEWNEKEEWNEKVSKLNKTVRSLESTIFQYKNRGLFRRIFNLPPKQNESK